MGVYIKGMEMPTSCGDCKAFVRYRQWAGDVGDCFCGITKNDANAKEKNADCPLIEIPPHGRLIDADAILQEATKGEEPLDWIDKNELLQLFFDAPTIIEAEEGE